MKLRASVSGFESVLRKLSDRGRSAAQEATSAAADALSEEIERSKDAEGIFAPLVRVRTGNRHSVGTEDPEAVEREIGSLNNEPAPWLAPVLPAARGPMRAAAVSAAARAISSRKGRS